jgi:hypothetical protein
MPPPPTPRRMRFGSPRPRWGLLLRRLGLWLPPVSGVEHPGLSPVAPGELVALDATENESALVGSDELGLDERREDVAAPSVRESRHLHGPTQPLVLHLLQRQPPLRPWDGMQVPARKRLAFPACAVGPKAEHGTEGRPTP